MMPILVKCDDFRSGTNANVCHGTAGYCRHVVQWVKLVQTEIQHTTLLLQSVVNKSIQTRLYLHSPGALEIDAGVFKPSKLSSF